MSLVKKPVSEADYFEKIKNVLDSVNNLGLIDRGGGYCFSMSDMIMKLLHKEGIECELVECSLMVMLKNPPALHLIGYPGTSEFFSKSKMENHVVCISKTPIPILIDASVKNIDPSIPYILLPISTEFKHTNLVEYDFKTSVWTYQQKKDSEIPKLHQESIIDRIKKDITIDKEIKFIKTFLFVLFTVSFLNFGRGMIDFYYTVLHPENHPTRDLKIKK